MGHCGAILGLFWALLATEGCAEVGLRLKPRKPSPDHRKIGTCREDSARGGRTTKSKRPCAKHQSDTQHAKKRFIAPLSCAFSRRVSVSSRRRCHFEKTMKEPIPKHPKPCKKMLGFTPGSIFAKMCFSSRGTVAIIEKTMQLGTRAGPWGCFARPGRVEMHFSDVDPAKAKLPPVQKN